MRSQLLVGGLLIAAMGAGFYLLELPFVYFWSLPFGIAGIIMVIISFFVPENEGSVQPPEGYRFCPFCSTPVMKGTERCPHCNGVQRTEV
ncbi:MAG TPA: hypothetical protein VLY82_05105 [Nitrososphaerales archaeon]|nr:hypothetical protein [Nitrososphaerales archaeon]